MNVIKKICVIVVLGLGTVLGSSAQQPTIAELFKAMPDSLFPYLSTNSRLDMIDFMEAGMRAEVKNLLDGDSEMTFLTRDSLSIKMSSILQVDMTIVPVSEQVDSSHYVVKVTRTYQIKQNQAVSIVDVFSTAWNRLSSQMVSSSLLKPDEYVFGSEVHL